MINKNFLLDLLFPQYCLNCGQFGRLFCDYCAGQLTVASSACPGCSQLSLNGRVCGGCVSSLAIDGLWSLTNYGDFKVKEIIKLIKYQYVTDLIEVFTTVAQTYFNALGDWPGDYVLVPIPLHRRRYLHRGFNQSELICQWLADLYGVKVASDVVKRRKNNPAQASLVGSHRQLNVKDIFMVNTKSNDFEAILSRPVVLVDDVYTSGSTMNECARVLKNSGVKTVWGLVLAKG